MKILIDNDHGHNTLGKSNIILISTHVNAAENGSKCSILPNGVSSDRVAKLAECLYNAA